MSSNDHMKLNFGIHLICYFLSKGRSRVASIVTMDICQPIFKVCDFATFVLHIFWVFFFSYFVRFVSKRTLLYQ